MANIKLNDPYVNFLLPSTEGNNISLDMADLGEYKFNTYFGFIVGF